VTYVPMALDRVRRAEAFLDPGEELVDALSARLGRPVHQPGIVLSILFAGGVGLVLTFSLRPFGILPAEAGAAVGFLGGMVAAHRFVARRYPREVRLASLPWVAVVRTTRRLMVIDYRALRRGNVRVLRSASLPSISGVSFGVRRTFGTIPTTSTATIDVDGDAEIDISAGGWSRGLRTFVGELRPMGRR